LLVLRGESEANIKGDEGMLLRGNRSIQLEGPSALSKRIIASDGFSAVKRPG
jgi:hypothetical protein